MVMDHVKQKGISKTDKRLYLAAWEKTSKKNIIRAKCIECCGFENVRERVFYCDVLVCPIHSLRKKYFNFKRREKNKDL